ncbi:MAG: CRISPR-associated helicase Cas3' [Desulfovibrionaceae bacterium]|jgi:CRISPR-associated endonuclease/helicase Cas3|nr:CRISPR-associated helicase Cas3' [Desulfovibrionaceae bacterium]
MIARYWGKAGREAGDGTYHPLACHGLDVAACAQALVERDAWLGARLGALCPFPGALWPGAAVFFVALHDAGKFSHVFQGSRPDLLRRLQGRAPSVPYGRERHHTLLATALLPRHVFPLLRSRLGLEAHDPEDVDLALAPLAAAVFGHHGVPVPARPAVNREECFSKDDLVAVLEYAELCVGLFLPPSSPGPMPELAACARFSWLLAGLCVLADWLGSDERFFPPAPHIADYADYYHRCALPSARQALDASGVLPAAARGGLRFEDLFPELIGHPPTPLQRHARDAELADGPQLHILEDLTGSGKTEAALILAARLMDKGLAQGLYFALPTMATSNAMYARLAGCYRRLFAAGERPSLTLAHGGRRLVDAYLASIPLDGIAAQGPGAAGTVDGDEAGPECAGWLADNAKKALLAPAGVGTVDQALLGVLPARHQSLRLLGLARNVLVVDEVHAYDDYVNALLCNLLRFHAALGGSAVLLSATLPLNLKRRLAAAFQEGLGVEPAVPASVAYPLAGAVSAGTGVAERAVEPAPWAPRRVAVDWAHDSDEACAALAAVARGGGCACWVRNAVDDAVEACGALRAMEGVDPDRVLLFHARFAAGDRLDVEQRLLDLFGKHGTDRAGRIVVATQVAEASLDVDFDFMVSDLASVEALIQRVGRLCRHRRGLGRTPRLLVHGPEYTDAPGADWYAAFFSRGRWVYPVHGVLWRTARVLLERGGLDLPGDARALVEAVHGDDAVEVPEGLARRDIRAEGELRAMAQMAAFNTLEFERGYATAFGDRWDAEERIPTRLGEPTRLLRLARWDGTRLAPWCAAATEQRAWSLSELRVRRTLLDSVDAPSPECAAQIATLRATWRGHDDTLVVPLVARIPNGWIASGVVQGGRSSLASVQVEYEHKTGLFVSRSEYF